MADDLKRVGLVFKADGTVDFKKSLDEVNSSIQENRSAFKLAQSQWDENTKTADKLRDKQEYLAKQTEDYSDKVKLLQRELDELENAEERNEAAINKKKNQLNQAKTSLNNYEKGLSKVEEELKSGTYKVEEYTKKIEDFSEKASKVGDGLSGVATAAAGVLTGTAALVPATEEYRKIMGSLEVSSELAGYTAEQTKESYRQLYGVLGDDQSAATTTANLQALGLSQEQLNQIVNGTIGAWAKYGDSIPIDGLAEAINETVKVGTVTGTFADVLNWAGTSEDAFNEKLAKCSSDSERANLIMQELANQGLTQAGEKWKENNQNLVEGNQATADMQEATAELAETVAPLITELTELAAGLLGKFNDLPTSVQAVIGIALVLVAASSTLFSVIGKVSMGVSSLSKFMGVAKTGMTALWTVMKANPVGAVITIVTVLITLFVTLYNKCEWFRDGVNKIWNGIKTFLKGIKDWLVGIFKFEWKLPKIKLPHFSINGKFSLSPPSIPKIGVEWYSKGAILTRPTAFDISGNNVKVGGEAGHEAVLPISLLKQYMREENKRSNQELIAIMLEVFKELKIVPQVNVYLGNENLIETMADGIKVLIGDTQVARWRAQGNV